jgi:alpha-galactosidase
MYRSILLFCFSCIQILVQAQFASWKDNQLILDNKVVQRTITIAENKLVTISLRLKGNDLNFNTKDSKEFSFLIDGRSYDGQSGWQLLSFNIAKDEHEGNGATIKLKGMDALSDVELELTYLLYPDLPVIRKQITIVNRSGKEIMLESFDIEKLKLSFTYVECVVFANYGRQKHLSTYIGNWDDPILAIHSYAENAGILLGNEAPGVLKRTDYNVIQDNVNIGLTHTSDIYPFRKYIKQKESWTSPRVFVIPYSKSADPWHTMNNELSDFERKHMGLRIFQNKKRPIFMYNNYRPFGSNFNSSLLISLAKAGAECGIRQFEVDCGWHTTTGNIGKKVEWIANTGDWIVDKRKFPNGLGPVFDTVRKMGMQPGLWVSVGSAASTSQVFKDHPEWASLDGNGHPSDLHDPSSQIWDLNTMCFATGWKDYAKEKILKLVKEFDLKFVKLDLTVLTSAYLIDPAKSGCYATNHPYHKDHAESFVVIYDRLFDLFDELHKEAPDLYIDCTFETEGKLQLVDYAFLEHAEGNWLTNISEPYPIGTYRIRNLAWWKSPAVPASSLIIGNLTMDSPDFINELKTLVGSFPIVLGDPRKLSKDQRAEIKQWSNWFVRMQNKYDYDLYRQDLNGFGEPVEGGWDGWSRINTDTKAGGIAGIFRQGSPDDTRTISISGLDTSEQYLVKLAPTNTVVAKMTGKALEEKGFKVKINKLYAGMLYEIETVGSKAD